jgi:hypothetical protein
MPSIFEVIVDMSETPSLSTNESPLPVTPSPLSVLDARLTTAESAIDALEAVDVAFDTRIDAIDAAIDAIEDDLDAIDLPCTSVTEVQTSLTNDTNGKPTIIKGFHAATGTINVINGHGGALRGYTRGAATPPGNDIVVRNRDGLYCHNTLFPRGAEDEDPLLYYDRAYVKIEDLALHGATWDQIAVAIAKAPVGLKMRRATGGYSGVGSGKIRAINNYWCWFRRAIDLGEDPTEFNCDESTWTDQVFDRCDVAVTCRGEQVLSHFFNNPVFAQIGIGFQMYGGGKIHVDGGFAAHPGVLFRYENDTPANFGPNTSMIRVDHLQLDAGVNRNYQFLTMESNANLGYHLDAVFRDIALPSDGFAWEVGIDTSGKAHVTLENITYLPTNFLTWHHGLVATGARVNYHIHNNRVIGLGGYESGSAYQEVTAISQLFKTLGASGECVVNATNNIDFWTGNKLPDFNGIIVPT